MVRAPVLFLALLGTSLAAADRDPVDPVLTLANRSSGAWKLTLLKAPPSGSLTLKQSLGAKPLNGTVTLGTGSPRPLPAGTAFTLTYRVDRSRFRQTPASQCAFALEDASGQSVSFFFNFANDPSAAVLKWRKEPPPPRALEVMTVLDRSESLTGISSITITGDRF
jgi:hypothetical protein